MNVNSSPENMPVQRNPSEYPVPPFGAHQYHQTLILSKVDKSDESQKSWIELFDMGSAL